MHVAFYELSVILGSFIPVYLYNYCGASLEFGV